MYEYLDISIVLGYLLLCLIIGFYKYNKVKTVEEYTLGKGNFSNTVMVGTLFATGISSSTTMGGVGSVYALNVAYILATLLKPLSWLLSGYIYSRKANLKDCLTLPDIIEKFYGTTAKVIVSTSVIITSIGFLSVQVTALANISNYFGINYVHGAVICVFIFTIYSVVGGIQSVALTDVLQFFIFFIVFPLVCLKGIENVGGIQIFVNKIKRDCCHIKITSNDIFIMLGMLLYFIPCEAPFIQRVLMQKKKENILKSFCITGALSVVFYVVIIIIGFLSRIQITDTNQNLELLDFASKNLGIGLTGVMICSILAVIMSTADSYLNTTSVIIAKDFIYKVFPNFNGNLLILRGVGLFVGFTVLPIALKNYKIHDIVFFVSNFSHPIILVPLILGFLGIKTNKATFHIALIGAVIATNVAAFYDGKFSSFSALIGIIASFTTFVVSHLMLSFDSKKNYLPLLMGYLNKQSFFPSVLEKGKFPLLLVVSFLSYSPVLIFFIKEDKVLEIVIYVTLSINLMLVFYEYWIKFIKNLDLYWKLTLFINIFTSILIIEGVNLSRIYIIPFGIIFLSNFLFFINLFQLIRITVLVILLVAAFNSAYVPDLKINFQYLPYYIGCLLLGFFILLFFRRGNTLFPQYRNYQKSDLNGNIPLNIITKKTNIEEKFFSIVERYYVMQKMVQSNFIHGYSASTSKQDLEILLEEIKSFVDIKLKQKKQKINFLKTIEDFPLPKPLTYQILFSIVTNVVNLAIDSSVIYIDFYNKDNEIQICLRYKGYIFSKKEILEFSKGERFLNTYLLNWEGVFKFLDQQEFAYEINKKGKYGEILITKLNRPANSNSFSQEN